ncbi:MAG: HXXEE domain-containing protein [Caldisericota bacterium]|nr:HXXEE domain-containing protein [Caldisericota bacterium]
MLGVISAIWLFWFFKPIELLFWAYVNIPLYFFYQTEEHLWPGGFKNFINHVINNLPEGEETLNDVDIFWINILLVLVTFIVFGLLALVNIGFGLLIIVFSIMNCLTHIVQGVRLKKWNPGLVMASLQFVVSIYAAYFVTVNGLTNPIIWWVSTVIFSVFVHAVLFKFILKN